MPLPSAPLHSTRLGSTTSLIRLAPQSLSYFRRKWDGPHAAFNPNMERNIKENNLHLYISQYFTVDMKIHAGSHLQL
ncbi:hypothetical protein SK128_015455 [Halocaridina rubra]|uniref:Uncharacterized protein n=1 Tax=Halocaridina rubra TaxID=373956 RepID=A0AAN8WGE9_HALRR